MPINLHTEPIPENVVISGLYCEWLTRRWRISCVRWSSQQ